MVRFQAVIHQAKKTATGIYVPEEVVAALGAGKKPAVKVTIGDYMYRSTIGSMGGQFAIPLSAEHREAANLAAGDAIEVQLELDAEPRVLEVPADFEEALDREADARQRFDGLSYSNRRRFVLSIEGAKTAETRQRRIDKAIADLKEGRV